MESEIIRATDEAADVAGQLRRLVPDGGSVASAVASIVADVNAAGDAAVRRYTQLHDTRGLDPLDLRVSEAELAAARAQLDPAVAAGIELAIENVGRVARAAIRQDLTVDFGDHSVSVREAPVRHAAVYVPGGRAPYPSTVVMGVATARAAGVQSVVVCSPPGLDGQINPVILGACVLTGADEVYRMGGAQAIAALAYGTESVAAVDVIVGPGNLYVQEAKRQLSGRVGIDSFAGPSDLLAIADPGYPLEPLALDLLAQAEHSAGAAVIGVSTDAELLETLAVRLARDLPETEAICRLVLVPTPEYALELAEAFAPEHLELLGPLAEQLALRITRSGCVFVGTGTAFGDYVAGSNHTLPTGGAARFASSLGPQHFRRVFSEVRVDNAGALARAAAPVARAEGFEFHAKSMEIRIRDNPDR
ncbi:MAG TPA: histidinol dehydrogenase [Solirubrobacteraceae bacterium]|jgi:histidinol dehydrogenase|nr:histidinol dehydrogenase [Solirubrobacteraceae bacterium]